MDRGVYMSAVLNMIIHHIDISIKEYMNSLIIFLIFTAIIIYISEKIGFENSYLKLKKNLLKIIHINGKFYFIPIFILF